MSPTYRIYSGYTGLPATNNNINDGITFGFVTVVDINKAVATVH